MAIKYLKTKINFEAVVFEDEVVALRDKLTQMAPAKITFGLKSCDDLHLSIIQQLLAYKKLYTCDFEFAEDKKIYQVILEGFDASAC